MATCPDCGGFLHDHHRCFGVWRHIARTIAVTAAGGAFGLVFLLDYLDVTIKTRTEAERLLKSGAVEINGTRITGIVFHAEPGTHTVRVGKKWKRITVKA